MTIPASRRDELRRVADLLRWEESHIETVAGALPSLLDEIDRLEAESSKWYKAGADGIDNALEHGVRSERDLESELAAATEQSDSWRTQAQELTARIAKLERFKALVLENTAASSITLLSAKLADLDLRLQVATDLNVGDRQQIAKLELALAVADQVAGEAKLVIEQQDRDLERYRSALREALDWWAPGELESRNAHDTYARLRKVLG
jgi:chromosome segregation ATPase